MTFRHALSLAFAAGLTSPVVAQTAITPRAPALLIHGNYCGPGNNAPLPPVDALDRACAHHDACTPSGGLPSPACNARLRLEADAVARNPRQPEDLRALAEFIATGAALLPSDPRGGVPVQYAAPSTRGYVPGAFGYSRSLSPTSQTMDDSE